MNTNRGSYLACAALGSAFVLALGTDAMADGYEMPPLKGGYEVPPPSDRHIYVKGYVGQANPDVGNIWTEVYATNAPSPSQPRHEELAALRHRHRLQAQPLAALRPHG